MAKSLGSKLPWLFADEFGNGGKNASLDCHLSMKFVVPVQSTQALNWKSKENDSTPSAIDAPPGNRIRIEAFRGPACHIKVNTLEFFWPERAQVMRRVRHGDVEGLDPASRIR